MKEKFLFLLLFLFFIYNSFSQIVNGYAKVSSISGATLTLSNVNEAADSFEDNNWVVLIQIQDNVIGTTTNTSDFGSLGSINSVGLHEIRQIESHTETAGVPTTITLKNSTNYSYNTCTNCSFQIVTFRKFGSPNYTTTSDMSALAWDGNIGGVLAFYVSGTLTLNHSLSADELGFRGGGTNAGGSAGCTPTGNYRVVNQANHADKGEGIYKTTNTNYVAGRGRILNGGGGGNSHNAGGGGGGNYTAGGDGGPGWNNCSPSAGGFGGLDLSSNISVLKIFMGGGAGAGEGNNGYATNGATGGGIILVKANEIKTTTCAGVSISANGGSIILAPGNDGGGGGGGGGSIVLEVNSWDIDAACTLTISSNGGNGGAVASAGTHGGGGGGGQGVVFYSTTEPTTNVTTETNNGTGGCNNNTVPCNSRADSGAGTDGSGVFDLLTGPLPVELIQFDVKLDKENVVLNWKTKSEKNNAYFEIERSNNGVDWKKITEITGAGTSSETIKYTAWDFYPVLGINYYRLKQIDFNGAFKYTQTKSIVINDSYISLYPNPSNGIMNIQCKGIKNATVRFYDALGNTVLLTEIYRNNRLLSLEVSTLPNGVYFVTIDINGNSESRRFVISH